MRSPLKPSDLHHLRAAEGWLELGSPAEARSELTHISAKRLDHPDVLVLALARYSREVEKSTACLLACLLIRARARYPLGLSYMPLRVIGFSRARRRLTDYLRSTSRGPSLSQILPTDQSGGTKRNVGSTAVALGRKTCFSL